MRSLKFSELRVGMEVLDRNKNKCVIVEIEDEHNIWIEGGDVQGISCLVKDCGMYDPLYVEE